MTTVRHVRKGCGELSGVPFSKVFGGLESIAVMVDESDGFVGPERVGIAMLEYV